MEGDRALGEGVLGRECDRNPDLDALGRQASLSDHGGNGRSFP